MIKRFTDTLKRALRFVWTVINAVTVLTYLIIARSFLFFTMAMVCLYFVSGSAALREGIEEGVSASIPGSLEVGGIQWGPMPGALRLVEIRIRDAGGAEVVHAPFIDLDIDVVATGVGLVRWATSPQAPLSIGVRHLRLREPSLRLIASPRGRMTLAEALSDGLPKPKSASATKVDVRVRLFSLHQADLTVKTPSMGVELRDLSLSADLSVHPDGDLRFRMPSGEIGNLDVTLPEGVGTSEAGERLTLHMVETKLQRVFWRDQRLDMTLNTDDLDGGTLSVRAEVDVGDVQPGWAADIALELPEESPVLGALSMGQALGPLQLSVKGGGSFEEIYTEVHLASSNLSVMGINLGNLAADVSIEPHITDDGLLTHRVTIPTASTQVLGGLAKLEDVRFAPVDTQPVEDAVARSIDMAFRGRVSLEGINPYALGTSPGLSAMILGMPGIDGALNLDLQVSGGRDRRDGLWFGALHLPRFEMGWKGLPGIPLAKEITLSTGLSFEQRLLPDGGLGLNLDVEQLSLKSDTDEVELSGSVALPRGALDLNLDVVIGRLSKTLKPLGIEDVSGRLTLDEFRITGTLESPDVVGSVRLREGKVGRLALGRLDAGVQLQSGVLKLPRMKLKAPWGSASMAGSATLWTESWRNLSSSKPFTIERLSAQNIVLHKLIRGSGVHTSVSVNLSKIRGNLAKPLQSLRGRGELRTTAVSVGGERAKEVSAIFRGDRDELALDDVIITLDGGEQIEASAALNKKRKTIKARLKTDALPFDAIDAIARGVVPLKGRVSADLFVEGSLDKPMVIGTLGLESFAYGGVVLGDGTLNFTTGEQGAIEISSSESFEGMEILEGSVIQLRRGAPEMVLFKVRAHDADVFSILPGVRIPDTTLHLNGLVDVELRPGDPERIYELRVDAEPGGLKLGLYGGEVQLDNLSPLYLVHDTQGLHIEETSLGRGTRESLSLCGDLGSNGDLNIQLGGEIDLDLLHALRGVFSSLGGRFVIADDPTTGHSLGSKRCLNVKGDRLMWLHGSTSNLKMSGRLSARRVALTPRGFGREIQLTDGSSIELRTGQAPGELRIILPEAQPRRFRGALESGGLEITGEVVLRDLQPDLMKIRVVGTDLFLSSPGEFNLTFNPELELLAENFSDPERRSVQIAGPVLITEGLYYKSFDRIAQALGSAGRDVPSASYSQPVTERIPWLKDIALDVQVSTPDFRIRSAFPMGQADLDARFDLRVGGTLGNLQLLNRVEILAGGQVQYKVIRRDFEIVSGTIDFSGDPGKPRLDIEAQTEVTYLPAAATEEQAQDERQVTVSLGIHGVPPSLQIEFWSKDSPNFTAADLQSLILTGRPRDESGSIQDRVGLSVDFGRLVNDIIKSPIVEALNITVGAESVTTRMIYRLGRAVRLKTRVVQEATETRVSAGFTFQLSDSLSLEGTLQRTDRSANPTQTYEARFKYRIPIE